MVYVAAVGDLWAANPQRGVFRTIDGGVTWERVLYVDENTGAIDLAMDPSDPKTVFAAMYQRRRTGFGFNGGGPGSGLYRTVDGGESWVELTEGLPEADKAWVEPTTMRGWLAYQRSRLLGFDRSEDNGSATSSTSPRRSARPRRCSDPRKNDFRTAIRLEPNRASALNSFTRLLFRKGRVAEANLTARRAYTADPYLWSANRNLWYAFSGALELQDRVEAQKWCSEGLRRFPDDYRFCECQVWTWALKGSNPDIDQAWQLCDEWVERAPEEPREFQVRRCQMEGNCIDRPCDRRPSQTRRH